MNISNYPNFDVEISEFDLGKIELSQCGDSILIEKCNLKKLIDALVEFNNTGV